MELKLCLAILVATAVLAQEPPSAASKRIEGVVLDHDTHQPVEGATVTIESGTGTTIKSSTDPRGHFEFEPRDGTERVIFATAPGYRQSSEMLIAAGIPNLVINLTKPTELRGIVVEGDSRKPLAGVPVHAYPLASKPLVTDAPGFSSKTSEDGSFQIGGLAAGSEHYLQIEAGPRPTISKISLEDVRGDAAQARRDASDSMGFAFHFWPGGGGDVPASGTRTLGGIVDLGEVPLRRIRLRKLAGWIETDCAEDDTTDIVLENTDRQRYAAAEIACDSGFEIQNLPDGPFSIFAAAGKGIRQIASQQFDERTRGPLRLQLAKPVLLTGTIEVEGIPADAFPAELAKLQMGVSLRDPNPLENGARLVRLEESPNRFELWLYPGEAYRFFVRAGIPSGIPGGGYYLKQIVHNGVPLPDMQALTSYGGDLRVVLSKHPAALQVLVQSDADKPMTECLVGVLKDGATNDPFAWQDKVSGKDGRVVFSGLAPGKYRVVALSPGKIVDGLSAFLQNATAVTLEEDRTATVTLHPAP